MNTSGTVHSKRVKYAFFARCSLFRISVDYTRLTGLRTREWGKTPTRLKAEVNPRTSCCPQYLESLIQEKLSKVNGSFWRGNKVESERLQDKENEVFIVAIKQIDKHTLNMYTPLRAGLGTRELSWIRLGLKRFLANVNGRRFQEGCKQ